MKRIFQLTLLCLLANTLLATAQTVTIYATRYKLRIYNYAEDPGAQYDPSDQTDVPVGMYSRPSGYDAEILCDFDLSVIPAGATINSVDFGYNVSSRTGGTHPVEIYKNTRSWSGVPQYDDLGNSAWPSSDLLASETCTGNGWRNFTSNANMKSLVEGWLSNPSSNRGVVLVNEPSYYGYYIEVTRVRLVVDYTPAVTEYDLTLTIGNNGSVEVSASGFPPTVYDDNVVLTFEEGTDVTLRAIPDAPEYDIQWSGDVSSTDETVVVGMDSDKAVTASFVENLRKRDSLALVAFYNATDGPNWTNNTNWLSGQPMDAWYGVFLVNGRIDSLSLDDNNLIGNLTPELGSLSNLQAFHLRMNQLSGPIPSELSNLTSLSGLALSINQLSGPIPPELGSLSNLRGVNFDNNQLSGPIPSELGNLTNLQALYINSNQLTGPIPSELGNLTQLQRFFVDYNQLTDLPEEIVNLDQLFLCDIGHNQFCTLSPTVETWADTFDPDWASTQNCPPPQIQITATPQTGPIPLTVDFTATNVGQSNIYTWAWDFGDGGTSTDQNPSHVYSTAGSFTAQVTATGIGGSTTESVTIDAYGPPVVSISATPQSGEVPLTVTFTASNTGGPVDTWSWDFGDGTNSNVQNPPPHTYTTAGDYNVTLTATNGAGIATDQVIINVTPPIVTLTMSVTGQGITSPSIGDTSVFQDVDVPIVATPGSSYEFVEWTVTAGTATIADPNLPSTTVRLSTNATINARFDEVFDPRKIDSLALVALYNATDGPNWTNNTNWLSGQTMDTWYGITILNNRVSEIFLNNNQLSGTIPSELGNLINLQLLNLSNNQLTGTIPSELGSLTNLQFLYLLQNQLIGTIPSELSNLINLQSLDLRNNQLTGNIPSELGDLNNLQALYFYNNQLTGTIPSELGNLTNIQHIYLHTNQFTGTIPLELGSLNNLMTLSLSNNQLTGTIPPELGNLTNLRSLSIQENQLTGSIPVEICNLTNLQDLQLGVNQLTGIVPPEIGNLTGLTYIYLTSNQLSGPIPSEFGNLTNLRYLYLSSNNFSNLPEEIVNLNQLTQCNLAHNQFCTLSPTVETWADTFDPDWASTQNCPTPEIQITATPQTGPIPLTVDFTATNIGQSNIDTWSWNFGDGATSNVQNPTHTYTTAGTFVAQCTATGIGGNTTESITITAIGPPVVSISATPQSGEAPLTVTFTGDITSGPVDTWHWDFGDGTSSTVQNPPPHTYTLVGTYTVVLTATNVAGTGTDQVTIDVLPAMATLTMTVTGQGTTSPSIGDTTVEENVDVPIAAIPASGYEFIDWTVTAGSATIADPNQSSTTARLSNNATVNAHFALIEYTLTVTAGPDGTTNPSGNVTATHGVPVTVAAIPDVGYNFALWTVETGTATIENPTADTTNVTLDNGDAEILATFVSDTNYVPYSQMLSITGTLYDEYGNPVGYPDPVNVDVSIRLTTAETDGDTVYTETFYDINGQAVIVDNGLFIARLGSGTSVDNLQAVLSAYENLFVEITVEDGTPDVLLPRTPLTAGPYTLTGPPQGILNLNTIHGNGSPNDQNLPGRIGMYYVDDETGVTYVRLNTGWKILD